MRRRGARRRRTVTRVGAQRSRRCSGRVGGGRRRQVAAADFEATSDEPFVVLLFLSLFVDLHSPSWGSVQCAALLRNVCTVCERVWKSRQFAARQRCAALHGAGSSWSSLSSREISIDCVAVVAVLQDSYNAPFLKEMSITANCRPDVLAVTTYFGNAIQVRARDRVCASHSRVWRRVDRITWRTSERTCGSIRSTIRTGSDRNSPRISTVCRCCARSVLAVRR